MNTKIFTLITENLQKSFNLARYQGIADSIFADTVVEDLPWTPARYRKFKDLIEGTLQLSSDFRGTVADIVNDLDLRYMHRFFGEIWKPNTDRYNYTGWALADEINKHDPKNVLDVGCGYNHLKGRIPNLVGIDPFNNCADYMVDILEYRVAPGTHDHIIVLGSINFNAKEDIEARFSHCVDLLAPGGRMYFRANPGIPHKTGPWVDIFPWSFEVVKEFETKYGLKLETFKKDDNRLYFVYSKP